MLKTFDPYRQETLQSFEAESPEAVLQKLGRASAAARQWRQLDVSKRADWLRVLAHTLREAKAEMSALAVREMGKVLTEAQGEIDKSAMTAEYYADELENFLQLRHERSSKSYPVEIELQPVGVVLAVMPWNFPIWQALRCVVPAIASGNAVMLKHATAVTGSSLLLETVLRRSGLPEDLFQALRINVRETPQLIEQLIADPRTGALAFTGSNEVGAQLGALAGAHVTRSVLELGGSDAFVVLDDADIDAAVSSAIVSRFGNAGQSCVAAKRILLADSISGEFVEKFVAAASHLQVGDPLDPATRMGPLINRRAVDTLESQIKRSVDAGAKLLLGGAAVHPSEGSLFPATVLMDVTPGMAVFEEETFGPSAAISTFASDEEAVRLANASQYGLGLTVWGESEVRTRFITAGIESGFAAINDTAGSDPRIPFGGVKASGYGRELAIEAIREFTTPRPVVIAKTSR